MRVTLFEYMVVISVSLNFPYPARVTLGKASEWPLLPRPKLCIYGGSGEAGNRNPKGRVTEAEERVFRRAQDRPEA
jgi:hypothetical protein